MKVVAGMVTSALLGLAIAGAGVVFQSSPWFIAGAVVGISGEISVLFAAIVGWPQTGFWDS